MKASSEKSSAASSRSAHHSANAPFFAKTGGAGFVAPVIQMKMTVNKPGDKFEQEADKMADKVMRMPAPPREEKLQRQPEEKLQKKAEEKKEEKIQKKDDDKLQKAAAPEDKLQRKGGDSAPSIGSGVQSAISGKAGGGQPLSSEVRGFMEPRFGADFSNIRIHHDAESASLNNQLSARAFTFQNNIFFSQGQYQPGSSEGRQLLAHELTHTVQQGHAVQRSPQISTTATPPPVQRLGVQDALDYFADKAGHIPGFTMLTFLLGFNPISMRSVSRTAANLLRALIELIPGGHLITQALDNHGVINKAAAWVEQKVKILGDIGGDIVSGLKRFIDSLSWRDIFNLGGVWDRAKRIFTEPIARLINFGASVAVEILKMVKDAILKPLAALAQGTRGYDLLKAILGEDPITGEPVPRNAETLLGGFMKLIGQEEIWENIKKGNAIARAWTWFQGALEGLMGLVRAVPRKIIDTLTSLTFGDIITVVGAFSKVVGAFASIAFDFIKWGLGTIWNLLEIIFDVVKPGIMVYIKKTGAALKSIIKNPLPFVGNLVKAAKLGFQNFADNFGEHLKAGLIDWLTGSLEGVYIPKALSLAEVGKFAISVLGISWAQIRGKIVKVLGPSGETIMKGLETGFDIVVALVTGGPAAAWELIKEKLNDLKDQVVSGIIGFVTDTVIKKAIPKLISMFIPGAGFISAIISIYDTVMVFVEKISKIIQVVAAFIDSIVAIAGGNITAAAKRVESILGGLLSLAISFLAGFLGLGKVTDKIKEVIQKVRASVDKAIDAAIAWIVDKAKKLFAKLFGKKDEKDERTPEQKKADLDKALDSSSKLLDSEDESPDSILTKLPKLQKQYRLQSLKLEEESPGVYVVHGTVNPDKKTERFKLMGDNFNISPHPADEPNEAKKNKIKGESHHVPVKVLLPYFAKLLKIAGTGIKDEELKERVNTQAKEKDGLYAKDGKDLSAIWITEEAHKKVHSISESVSESEVGIVESKAKLRKKKSELLEAEVKKEAEADALKGGLSIPKTGSETVMVKSQVNPLLAFTRREHTNIYVDKLKKSEKNLNGEYINELNTLFGKIYRGTLATGLALLTRTDIKPTTLKPKKKNWKNQLTGLANVTWSGHVKVKK